jgi:type I restriction enzyme R subunit
MLPHIDGYVTAASWQCVSEVQKSEITRYVAPLVEGGEGEDIRTRMYDLRMLRIELALLMSGGLTKKVMKDVEAVVAMAKILMKKYSIPEVEDRREDIESLVNEMFWKMPKLEAVEKWRRKLRGIMKYAGGDGESIIYLDIGDEIKAGDPVDVGIEFRSYRQKVIDFLQENWSLPVVEKIHKLEPLTEADMGELEDILWHKLGSKTDYDGEDYAGSLAGFVRSLVGLDQAAVNEKFGQYLTGTVFNSNQQEFVKMVINYVRENGEITRSDLVNSYPFRFLQPVQLFGDKMPILLSVIAELEKLLPKVA